MNIDIAKLKLLAEAAKNDCGDYVALNDYGMAVPPAVVLALIAENERLKKMRVIDQDLNLERELIGERDQLKAENESLKRERTDWQAECLKKGFEYVREPDAHYVLADVPEMAALLAKLLGVEVRSKDNDDYGETVSSLNEQIEACNSVYGRAYDLEKEVESLRKDAERYRWLCDGNGYFMEEQGLCGHSNEKEKCDKEIDITMSSGERP